MAPKPRPVIRLAAAATALLVLVAGCGGGTAAVESTAPSATVSPTLAPTASPTARPTPTPTPKPTASPSPTAEPTSGFIDTLRIGSPYRLVDNPANTALHGKFNFEVGSISVTETLTGLEIHDGATPVGLAYVIEFDGTPMTDAAFEGGARGAAATSGGKLTYSKVLGQRVAFIVAKAASFGMYRDHEVIVMVGAETVAQMKTLLTSVMKASL